MPQACLSYQYKPRQHLCYVYASLSRLDFRSFPENLIIVFEGVRGFFHRKKANRLNDALVERRSWRGLYQYP